MLVVTQRSNLRSDASSEQRVAGPDAMIDWQLEAMITRLTTVMFALYLAQSAFVVVLTVVVVKVLKAS